MPHHTLQVNIPSFHRREKKKPKKQNINKWTSSSSLLPLKYNFMYEKIVSFAFYRRKTKPEPNLFHFAFVFSCIFHRLYLFYAFHLLFKYFESMNACKTACIETYKQIKLRFAVVECMKRSRKTENWIYKLLYI